MSVEFHHMTYVPKNFGVHQHVHKSGGSVNKNIGDAFLTVWKLNIHPDDVDMWSVPIGDSSEEMVHSPENSAIADSAMHAFVKLSLYFAVCITCCHFGQAFRIYVCL